MLPDLGKVVVTRTSRKSSTGLPDPRRIPLAQAKFKANPGTLEASMHWPGSGCPAHAKAFSSYVPYTSRRASQISPTVA